MIRHPVQATPEFQRIDALPRRRLEDLDSDALAAEFTRAFRTPWGTMSLRPVQALALRELALAGGLFGPMGVGSGKTLVSLLAPSILDAKRPVLLLPASLVEKTVRDKREADRHFMLVSHLQILSYESLGIVSGANTLENIRPDLLILDEAHRVRNRKAGVTRRVERYLDQHPETKVVAMSGTMVKKSIGDFAHLVDWVLKDRSPLPRSEGDLMTWVNALDGDVNPLEMVPPGVLLQWSTPEETKVHGPVRAARLGFQRRLLETPGVVATRDESVDASLYVRALPYKVSFTTEANYEKLRTAYETPDGWPLEEASQWWALGRQLALGLHYEWQPRPPQAWVNARREWCAFVRDVLSRSRSLDTPHQVELACLEGKLDGYALREWKAVEKSFVPNPVDVWHDEAALDVCASWMKKGAGIVWVEHTFFGEGLAKRTGAPYFANDGLDAAGNYIDSETGKRPIIASIASNATGRNLQMFRRNLVTAIQGASTMEQLIGRTHRSGQLADEIEVDLLVGCSEHVSSFHKALAGARMAQDTQGASQKLLTATVDMPSLSELKARSGGHYRWLRNEAASDD